LTKLSQTLHFWTTLHGPCTAVEKEEDQEQHG